MPPNTRAKRLRFVSSYDNIESRLALSVYVDPLEKGAKRREQKLLDTRVYAYERGS